MNNKYAIIIIALFGLIMLGVFTAWLLVSRGIVSLPAAPAETESGAAPSGGGPTPSVFPAGGSSDSGGALLPSGEPVATSSIIDLGPRAGNQINQTLIKLETRPIGGLVALTQSVIFFERPTGHLYQIAPTGAPVRLSNTTIPKLVSALGRSSASSTRFIIGSYNPNLSYQLATLKLAPQSASSTGGLFLNPETALFEVEPEPLVTKPLPINVLSFAASPSGKELALLEQTSSGADLIIADWDLVKREKVLSLPLSQLNMDWPASSTIALATRASGLADGFLYLYDTKTKKLSRAINNVSGLAAKVSPDAQRILYSGSSGTTLFTAMYDRRSGEVVRLPFKTLAEKCTWSGNSAFVYCGAPDPAPAATYPDAWYQGAASLEDNLWQYDVKKNQGAILFNPKLNNLGEKLDAFQLAEDSVNKLLYFVNRRDLSLWRLDLGSSF